MSWISELNPKILLKYANNRYIIRFFILIYIFKMGQITRDSKIEAVLPVAVTALVSQKVLVMTRLYGFKVIILG